MASYQNGFPSKFHPGLYCIVFVFSLLLFAASGALAEGILVFSTTHNNDGVTQLTEPEGVLKLEITTFSPIVSLRVNQESKTPQSPTRTSLSIPYRVTGGSQQLTVDIRTEQSQYTKSFLLQYDEKGKTARKGEEAPFTLLGGIGLLATDNATKVKDEKKAGQKLVLMVLPSLQFKLGQQRFEAKGILLREKFLDSELASAELVYTKIEGIWLHQAGFGDWNLVLGLYDTGSQSSSFSAENEVEKGYFLQGRFKLNGLAKENLELVVGYALKDQPEQLTADYDGDGAATQVEGIWNQAFGSIKGRFQGELLSNDAKGKYKDYSRIKLSAYGEYPLSGILSVGGSYLYKMMAYSQSDPVKGDKELSTTNTVTLGGKLVLKQLGGMVLVGALQMQSKSSSIEAFTYTETSIGVTAVYKF